MTPETKDEGAYEKTPQEEPPQQWQQKESDKRVRNNDEHQPSLWQEGTRKGGVLPCLLTPSQQSGQLLHKRYAVKELSTLAFFLSFLPFRRCHSSRYARSCTLRSPAEN